ncbi:MAG TPA: diaminopimelate decarboxylase [Usitatibacteraceae bacterium]|nr:diaminopimelate decarboxylase [Usitatibacteraceae bacterium]
MPEPGTFGVRRDAASGRLWMEDVDLVALAAQQGTPCYVYSEAALTRAWQALDSALAAARAGRPYLICYAVKANSNLAVLSLFARLGAGFDIVSGGELLRVLKAGGSAAKVVFSGLGKTEAEMRMALKAGIKCFNIESEPELERLNTVAASLGLRAPVSLRVNPDVDARTHPYISTGLRNNKFGVAFEWARRVYQRAAALPNIDVAGVDCHIGSQLTDAAPLQEAMARLVALADELALAGIPIRHICPGGGIGITYRDERPIDLKAYARALQAALGERRVELLLEPGRALVGNAGVLLTRVEYVKDAPDKRFLVVDAAMNDLIRPALYQAHHEVLNASRDGSGGSPVDVVGPVCESSDVLAAARALDAQPGDVLAVLSAGAYGFVMSSNYNTRARAAEVLVSGSQSRVVRRRETLEDLIAHESA